MQWIWIYTLISLVAVLAYHLLLKSWLGSKISYSAQREMLQTALVQDMCALMREERVKMKGEPIIDRLLMDAGATDFPGGRYGALSREIQSWLVRQSLCYDRPYELDFDPQVLEKPICVKFQVALFTFLTGITPCLSTRHPLAISFTDLGDAVECKIRHPDLSSKTFGESKRLRSAIYKLSVSGLMLNETDGSYQILDRT